MADVRLPALPERKRLDPRDLFEILVRENADMLWAFLRSAVSDAGTAEDLFQETFMAAWRNLGRYDRTRPFGPWLRGIAGRLVMAERRRRSRVPTVDARDLGLLEGHFDAFGRSPGDTWGDKLEALRRCLDRLRPPLRQVVELRYEGGLACQAIAATLGDSTEAVKKRLQRARSHLADCLESQLARGES